MAQTIFPITKQYEEYLIDESKYVGHADSISFPKSEQEMQDVLAELRKENIPVTIQGGKTGITGAGISEGGHVMNLSGMNHVKRVSVCEDGTGEIVVEPGINIIDLRKEIQSCFRKERLFWPPDPTETSATIGGIIATGAQGISKLHYGKTSQYVKSVSVMDYEGNVKVISNAKQVFGREGITGIITEAVLKLIKKPEAVWGIAFFFEEESQAGGFVDQMNDSFPEHESAAVVAVEYIDRSSMDRIEARKSNMAKIKELPSVDSRYLSMVYTEIHGTEEGIEEIAEQLMELAMANGSDPDDAWAVSGEADVEKLHAYRHGAAETANLYVEACHRVDPRITKLGTDMTIMTVSFSETLERCKESLKEAGLEGTVFGHALENHLHINIFPKDYEEYRKGCMLIKAWVQEADDEENELISEHGIGKLKRDILEDAIPQNYIEFCKKLKQLYDADEMINRGNIYRYEK